MNVTLQRHCARYIYIVPECLKELMSDISREVLRSQPTHLACFIADYLDALLITRENARVATRLVQSITEMSDNVISILEETGIGKEDAYKLAHIMREAFEKSIGFKLEGGQDDVEEEDMVKAIIAKAGVNAEQAETAAVVIQQAYRRFKERKEHEKELLAGVIDWRTAARCVNILYRQSGVTGDEAHRASTAIKSAYKGYYTRVLMRKLAAQAALLFSTDSFVGLNQSGDLSEPVSATELSEDILYEQQSQEDDSQDSSIDSTEKRARDVKKILMDIVGNALGSITSKDSNPKTILKGSGTRIRSVSQHQSREKIQWDESESKGTDITQGRRSHDTNMMAVLETIHSGGDLPPPLEVALVSPELVIVQEQSTTSKHEDVEVQDVKDDTIAATSMNDIE